MIWVAKIVAKLFLSRLPIPYSLFRKLSLFVHGKMEDPVYALNNFKQVYALAGDIKNFNCLEIGPGDSLLSGPIAYGYTAQETVLVDCGSFANQSIKFYEKAFHDLKLETLSALAQNSPFLDELLRKTRTTFLTQGLKSLQSLPDKKFDFVWSNAVMEHIRLKEVKNYLQEMRRVLKPQGFAFHCIDLQDHLANSINHLRFAHGLWESDFFANSGFYTNRLLYSQWCELFDEAGFNAEILSTAVWNKLPIPAKSLNASFQHVPEDILKIKGFTVLLRPKPYQ